MTAAIQAENLGKWFRMRGLAPQTLFGRIGTLLRGRKNERFWALQGLTFEVRKGCTLGIIGPNGAGKSSLLGLIAGTITPSEGWVRAQGRISSLLELGAGFHPDLSGRENIYLNASILGIPREDIRKRFDRIVDFSGLREFIDMPVRHYSSGMYVRLGFAVAVEMDPDILLIDEVLAVGDVEFQHRCLDRMKRFQRAGKTILFVSHALQTVEEFCDEAMLIHHGRMISRGDPADTIIEYLHRCGGEGGPVRTHEYGSRQVEFTEVRLLDEGGTESTRFTTGKSMIVEIHFHAHQPVVRPVFGFSIKSGNGIPIFGSNTQIEGRTIERISGEGVIRLVIDPLLLMEGHYFLSLSIHSEDHKIQYHRREDWYPFAVHNPLGGLGMVHLHCRWELPPAQPSHPAGR
ncbi:MAG: ABC transporter ATP-binding protein [Verrucomicrobia bacterium]|nr:MAG: ABC transporter ATP-binding protein [Verrucomicrobiota bacterium]